MIANEKIKMINLALRLVYITRHPLAIICSSLSWNKKKPAQALSSAGY